MGLVDLRKTSSSSSTTSSSSSMMATTALNGNRSNGSLVTLSRNVGESNNITSLVVAGARKKRTFDIAFLTGQEDVEEKLNVAKQSPVSLAKKGVVNNTGPVTTSSSSLSSAPMNSTTPHDDSSNNSECSSIDVMTNGSLSESESNFGGPLSLRLAAAEKSCFKVEKSPSPPTKVKPTRPDVFHVKVNNNNNNNSNHVRNNNNNHHSTPLKHGKKGGSGKSNYQEGITLSSTLARRHEDEIRFETRRTLDINQTSETVKIKENVHFSTTFGSSSISALTPAGLHGHHADLLPFALLPQIAKFPNVHLSPFSAKIEKDGLNLLAAANNYPNKINASAARHHLNQNSSPHQFPDHPYNHLNIQIASGSYGPYGPGLPMPMPHHELRRSPNNGSTPNFASPNSNNNHNHHHHQLHLPSGSPTGLHSNSVGLSPPTSGSSSATSSSSSASPNSHLQAAAAVAAAAAAATLLPPSLTALTLPAQNVCAKCNIGFRMTSDLVYHMRSHHKRDRDVDPMKKKREEKLKCPVCHETFRERHHLTRHMTAHQDRAEENEEKILNVV